MPTYEYKCTACGHDLEAFQSITEAPLTDCPKCSQSALTRLISATNFQLKGTGWYVTDIRDKGKPKPATETSEAKPDTTKVDKPAADSSKTE